MGKKKEPSEIYEELKNKHESDLTKKEKRLLEREKLSTMSIGGKLGYIWAYYKIWIFALVGVIILGNLAWEVYDNKKNNTILSISLANAGMGETQILSDNFKEYLNNDNPRDLVEIAANLSFSLEQPQDEENALQYTSQMEYASQAALITSISAQTVDVLIGPSTLYEGYREQELFLDLRELLTPEQQEKYTLTEDGYALVLDQVPLLTDYVELIYSPVYITVAANAPHTEMAAQYLTYLLEGN